MRRNHQISPSSHYGSSLYLKVISIERFELTCSDASGLLERHSGMLRVHFPPSSLRLLVPFLVNHDPDLLIS